MIESAEACGEQQRVDHRVQPDPRAEPEFLSVLPEYDFQRGWGLYRTQIRSHEVDGNEGVLQGSFTNTESDLKQQHWILVRYPISTPLELIAEKVQESMSFVLFDVAPTADSVAVLIFKQGQQQIRAKLKLGAIEPQSLQVATACVRPGERWSKTTLNVFISLRLRIPQMFS